MMSSASERRSAWRSGPARDARPVVQRSGTPPASGGSTPTVRPPLDLEPGVEVDGATVDQADMIERLEWLGVRSEPGIVDAQLERRRTRSIHRSSTVAWGGGPPVPESNRDEAHLRGSRPRRRGCCSRSCPTRHWWVAIAAGDGRPELSVVGPQSPGEGYGWRQDRRPIDAASA